MRRPLRFRRPDLLVDDPLELALRFFSEDRSSAGSSSYDVYVAESGSPANRIIPEDVRAINATMRARSPLRDWKEIISRGDLPELAAVDVSWDLFRTVNREWNDRDIPAKLAALFETLLGKGIGISRATKVLHIKRPHLIPVCDSYVLRLMGIPGKGAASAVALIQHLRSLRNELRPALVQVQRELRKRGVDRTLVRVADALMWSSYPDTWLARSRLASGMATQMATQDSRGAARR